MKSDKSISMLRLNPKQPSQKITTRDLFPPHGNYFTDLINNGYKTFLEADATTDDRIMVVAQHYGAQRKWKSYLQDWNHLDRAEKYYNLLLIVKTMSKEDHVWISFIEGLHQHAAIVMCLMCSGYDLVGNYIEQGSLKKRDFKEAGVSHYKSPKVTPLEHLNAILEGHFEAEILMTPFSIQVLFPKQNNS